MTAVVQRKRVWFSRNFFIFFYGGPFYHESEIMTVGVSVTTSM